MTKEVIISRPQCSSCGKIRPSGWIANLWIVCKWCEAGWFCPTCWGIHDKACKEKYLHWSSSQPQPAPELDLGTLPSGEKITVDPSELCPDCCVGVAIAACEKCGKHICAGCVATICEDLLCWLCCLNSEE